MSFNWVSNLFLLSTLNTQLKLVDDFCKGMGPCASKQQRYSGNNMIRLWKLGYKQTEQTRNTKQKRVQTVVFQFTTEQYFYWAHWNAQPAHICQELFVFKPCRAKWCCGLHILDATLCRLKSIDHALRPLRSSVVTPRLLSPGPP